MQGYKRACMLLASVIVATGIAQGAAIPSAEPSSGVMQSVVQQYTADRMSLTRTYPVTIAPAHMERMEKFYQNELARLAAINFSQLSHED